MADAIRYGNRLIMLHQGRIALDLAWRRKEKDDCPQVNGSFPKARWL